MNRTGLFIALTVGISAALLFAVFPQLDLSIARLFYDSTAGHFVLGPVGFAEYVRRAAMWLAWALAAPAIVAPLLKMIWPDKPLLVPGRAIIFLITSLLLTAIVLPNIIFKEHWGRPRPITTIEFNGAHKFTPWWDTRGTNPHNGSFFSGEAATAFWTYAPAALAPASVQPLAFVAATIFGLTTGLLRMAFGGHYASDVIAAGVAAYLVAWIIHGLVYRWKTANVLTDERIDQWYTSLGVRLRPTRIFGRLLLIVVAVTIARLVALKFSVVDLFPDEARYWAWAQKPAFGYFSKPPLIAWIIAGAGHLLGNSEACVRAPAAFFYAGTACVCFFIARHLYGECVAFWTGLSILLATGVVFSARIISTDVPLLFFWSLALLAYLKLIDRPGWGWTGVLGVALGFGLLAKYAMIYFLLGMLVTGFIDPRGRDSWRKPSTWLAFAIALLIVSPNLFWNATHDFATFRHTQGNIAGRGIHFSGLDGLNFVAGQFAVCGPILFACFVLALVMPSRLRLDRSDRIMIAFALPPLVLVMLAAIFTGAKGNWAAPSAICVIIVAVALLVRHEKWRWLGISVALGCMFQITLMVTDALADRISVPFLAKRDVYHRTLGWKNLASFVRQSARGSGAASIASEQQDVVVSLLYYMRNDRWPILSRPLGDQPANQFDLDRPLTPSAPEPVLYVSDWCTPSTLGELYNGVESLPAIKPATGPTSSRKFCLFKLSGARPADAPPPSAPR